MAPGPWGARMRFLVAYAIRGSADLLGPGLQAIVHAGRPSFEASVIFFHILLELHLQPAIEQYAVHNGAVRCETGGKTILHLSATAKLDAVRPRLELAIVDQELTSLQLL